MSARTVLVTGATGFVGRHLVAELLARGHRVRAVARDMDRARAMPWFDAVDFRGVDLHADTLDVPALTADVDTLVHLAWPGLPAYDQLFHFERNLPAAYDFIKRAVQAGVARVQVTGTCFEYGLQSGMLGEDCLPQPANPYGLAKHTLHRFLQALRLSMPFELQWARLFYLHGEGQNPRSLLASLDRAIDDGATSFPMSGGEQLRDYLPVERAATYLAALLEHPTFDGVVNCCSGRPRSVRALVEAHLAERGASISLRLGEFGYSPHEPMAFWGDSRRMQTLLGEDDGH